ncbi:RNA polymerase sigma factor [Pontibacter silvestris]|uniref:RNA polymerase sigma factor n=1 Tax=Pontibacter silvestris TaxID=2305183 RepID=A0ABW4WZ61_9BACT|nr:sigma-70 family RNA polymerase sigma factor [Pontibacter silvestris]MCC9135501.1 sigma-70 family RNA polymerase sigma factor [Pontibacter silvestris]
MQTSCTRTDAELLTALQEGDESAFRLLYERYWSVLYTMLYRRLLDEEATKDIVQNIFVSLWLNKATVPVEESLAPYLTTAARNQAISHYKKHKATLERETHFQGLNPLQHSSEQTLEAGELELMLDREINQMPENMKKAFVLSRMEERSIKEIATELCLSEQTVKNNISQALQRLQKKVKTFYAEPANVCTLLLILLTNS